MEEGWSTFRILTGKPTGKIALGRLMYRLENNVKMILKEIGAMGSLSHEVIIILVNITTYFAC